MTTDHVFDPEFEALRPRCIHWDEKTETRCGLTKDAHTLEKMMEPTYVRTLTTDPITGWKLWADIWQHEDGTFGYTVQATDRRITDGAQAPYLDDVAGIENESDANMAADLALRNVADGLRRTVR